MTAKARVVSWSMTEDQLLSNVLELCTRLGLRTAHFRPARTAQGWRTPVQGHGKGFPDLVVVGPGGVLYRELKSDRGSLTADQREWLTALTAAGVDADVWKPAHWHGGQILHQLKCLARGDGCGRTPGWWRDAR